MTTGMNAYVSGGKNMDQLTLNLSSLSKKPSQRDILLDALLRGERLTVATALMNYGVYALSQRMGELRKDYPIQSRTITTHSGKHVSEYWLEK
jgi:hypothetical protein